MNIKRIKTAGYRGPGTNMQYLAPGWYEVGNSLDILGRVIPAELAAYLVDTGQMAGFEVEAEETETKTIPDMVGSESQPLPPEIVKVEEKEPSHELVTDVDGEVWDVTLLNSMTLDELRALAKAEGVKLPSGRVTKESLIDRIVRKEQ